MIDKITNLVKQMSSSEKQLLYEQIKNQYCLEEKSGMLRDDISFKIRELLEAEHTWLMNLVEENALEELDLDIVDITSFTDTLIREFELEDIDFASMMGWETVKDIVNYIEEALENRGLLR